MSRLITGQDRPRAEITGPLDVRYCTCCACGKKQYLVWDNTNRRYLALCPVCQKYAPLPEPPRFTM